MQDECCGWDASPKTWDFQDSEQKSKSNCTQVGLSTEQNIGTPLALLHTFFTFLQTYVVRFPTARAIEWAIERHSMPSKVSVQRSTENFPKEILAGRRNFPRNSAEESEYPPLSQNFLRRPMHCYTQFDCSWCGLSNDVHLHWSRAMVERSQTCARPKLEPTLIFKDGKVENSEIFTLRSHPTPHFFAIELLGLLHAWGSFSSAIEWCIASGVLHTSSLNSKIFSAFGNKISTLFTQVTLFPDPHFQNALAWQKVESTHMYSNHCESWGTHVIIV